MGIFKEHLLFFGILDFLLAFIGFSGGLEIYRVAEVIFVAQNFFNRAAIPMARSYRVIIFGSSRPLKFQRSRCDD